MSASIVFIVLGVAVLLFLLAKSTGKKKANPTSAPSQSGWFIGPIVHGKNYSEGMPARPTMQGAGWTFTFPTRGGVDAVINPNPPSLIGVKSITMRFAVTGSGFHPSDDNSGIPASVGLSIQRRGDNWTGSGQYQSYRWYSNARITLKAGEFTLTAPLTVREWHDVQGKSDNAAAFLAVINDLDNLSVVFGGQASSHGVYAIQPSTFQLLDIQ